MRMPLRTKKNSTKKPEKQSTPSHNPIRSKIHLLSNVHTNHLKGPISYTKKMPKETPILGEDLGNMSKYFHSGQKRKVLVINTGGTASMKHGPDGLDTVPGYLSERVQNLEELSEPGMPDVTVTEYAPLIDSSHMEPKTWIALAADIEEHYYEYDGFVIVMGTDTMAYASSALSFMLEDLNKCVIFTGSQIPLCQPYTDCRRNVLVSIILAANGDFCEVCLFFSDTLLRANRAVKVNSFGLDAYASPNCEPLATLATGMRINDTLKLPPSRNRFRAHKHLATGIPFFSPTHTTLSHLPQASL